VSVVPGATKKQAVVLIHGIGFQRPMRTLRGFVDTVWVADSTLRNPHVPSTVWSKPDTVSESFELRRLTTGRNLNNVRTDFFEFYWAHLLGGTSLGQLAGWVKALLLRSPALIPRPLKAAYYILWIVTIVAGLALLNSALPEQQRFWQSAVGWSAIIGVVVVPLISWVLREIVGDAAVYLDDAPTNIQTRHEVRSAGVKLLKNLLERDYERIIVVGHSLGTVIGYDVLKYLWAELHDKVDAVKAPKEADHVALQRAAEELEDLSSKPDQSADTRQRIIDLQQAFVDAQRAYFDKLTAAGSPWKISDFVTLGSPLAHAELLLARGAAELAEQKNRRELPTCPPFAEPHKSKGLQGRFWFTKEVAGTPPQQVSIPHHAALFAPTVWTNVYFPCRALLWGDLIGGPIASQLGHGVRDVPVSTGMRLGLLSHTLYWTEGGNNAHILALREALDLAR